MDDITLDSIGPLRLYQRKEGYRFSVDAVLLAHFPVLSRKTRHVADLCAGSGVVGLLIAKRFPWTELVLVELQESLAELARRNIVLNGLEERVSLSRADIRELGKGTSPVISPGSLDAVAVNPPFRPLNTGRISPAGERAIARHEIALRLDDLMGAVKRILKNGGRLYIIYHPSRLSELIESMRREGIEPKRMRFVHPRKGESSTMVLVEGLKGGGVELSVEPPLYVYRNDGGYTSEVEEMLGGSSKGPNPL
jgi:tRNA1Val (adenine37-N6)-methyltransferase